MTFPVLREGSVQPTPRATDPTTPQTWNPPPNEDLGRAPKKLKRASGVMGGDSQSWLAARKGVREDVSPLTSLAPGRLSTLPEMEAEDESVIQREYARLMKSRDAARRAHEKWEKENQTAAPGVEPSETSMDVDQGASSAISTDYPATVHGIRRTDTEELFN